MAAVPPKWNSKKKRFNYNAFDLAIADPQTIARAKQTLIDSLDHSTVAPSTRGPRDILCAKYIALVRLGVWSAVSEETAWSSEGVATRIMELFTWHVDTSKSVTNVGERMLAPSCITLGRQYSAILREKTPMHEAHHADWDLTIKKHSRFLCDELGLSKSPGQRPVYGLGELIALVDAIWIHRRASSVEQVVQHTLLWVLGWMTGARPSTMLATRWYKGLYLVYDDCEVFRHESGRLGLRIKFRAFKCHHLIGDELIIPFTFLATTDPTMARFDGVTNFILLGLIRQVFVDHPTWDSICQGSDVILAIKPEWKKRPIFCVSGARGGRMNNNAAMQDSLARIYLHRAEILAGIAAEKNSGLYPYRRGVILRTLSAEGTVFTRTLVGHNATSDVAMDTYAASTDKIDLVGAKLYGKASDGAGESRTTTPAIFRIHSDDLDLYTLTIAEAHESCEELVRRYNNMLAWTSALATGILPDVSLEMHGIEEDEEDEDENEEPFDPAQPGIARATAKKLQFALAVKKQYKLAYNRYNSLLRIVRQNYRKHCVAQQSTALELSRAELQRRKELYLNPETLKNVLDGNEGAGAEEQDEDDGDEVVPHGDEVVPEILFPPPCLTEVEEGGITKDDLEAQESTFNAQGDYIQTALAIGHGDLRCDLCLDLCIDQEYKSLPTWPSLSQLDRHRHSAYHWVKITSDEDLALKAKSMNCEDELTGWLEKAESMRQKVDGEGNPGVLRTREVPTVYKQVLTSRSSQCSLCGWVGPKYAHMQRHADKHVAVPKLEHIPRPAAQYAAVPKFSTPGESNFYIKRNRPPLLPFRRITCLRRQPHSGAQLSFPSIKPRKIIYKPLPRLH
ncbi:hypothetical protein C8R43DRAFT_984079 [Mycena crocata]|nr:hypothetical protein C8R43DRAFT_984079 [Mycena crocata]